MDLDTAVHSLRVINSAAASLHSIEASCRLVHRLNRQLGFRPVEGSDAQRAAMELETLLGVCVPMLQEFLNSERAANAVESVTAAVVEIVAAYHAGGAGLVSHTWGSDAGRAWTAAANTLDAISERLRRRPEIQERLIQSGGESGVRVQRTPEEPEEPEVQRVDNEMVLALRGASQDAVRYEELVLRSAKAWAEELHTRDHTVKRTACWDFIMKERARLRESRRERHG